jgi:hypothetical protein
MPWLLHARVMAEHSIVTLIALVQAPVPCVDAGSITWTCKTAKAASVYGSSGAVIRAS